MPGGRQACHTCGGSLMQSTSARTFGVCFKNSAVALLHSNLCSTYCGSAALKSAVKYYRELRSTTGYYDVLVVQRTSRGTHVQIVSSLSSAMRVNGSSSASVVRPICSSPL